MDVEQIRTRLAGNALVRSVDDVPRGPVRIETAFLYPEGSSVDLFVLDSCSADSFGRLSDVGETMDWLLDVQIQPETSPRLLEIVNQVLHSCGVTLEAGSLSVALPTIDDLPDAIVRLGQACLRVADLVYTLGPSSLDVSGPAVS